MLQLKFFQPKLWLLHCLVAFNDLSFGLLTTWLEVGEFFFERLMLLQELRVVFELALQCLNFG
jgi:hypothetical protein